MYNDMQGKRMRRIPALTVQLALATTMLLGAASGASASLVTYNFSGGTGADAFTASFSYDSDTPDANPEPYSGFYFAGASFPMSYSYSSAQGSFSGSTVSAQVTVVNDFLNVDYIELSVSDGAALVITLDDTTQTAFSSDALPTHLSLDQFTSSSVYAVDPSGRQLASFVPLTSLVNAVPEPSSVALVLAGLVALAVAARLRRRQLHGGHASSV